MPDYCEVALPVPLDKLFTYSVPDSLAVRPGVRVIVPFGSRQLAGVVVRCGAPPAVIESKAIKPIKTVLDAEPALSPELLRLGRWLADYYLVPEGEVLATMLPPKPSVQQKTTVVLTPKGQSVLLALASRKSEDAVPAVLAEDLGLTSSPRLAGSEERKLLERLAKRKGIRRETLRDVADVVARLRRRGWIALERTMDSGSKSRAPVWDQEAAPPQLTVPFDLTARQNEALARIAAQMESGRFGVLLIHGVTGSGKTEIYLRAIELALQRSRSALLMVPEIVLTPAVADLFVSRFGARVAVLHSGLSDIEREGQWRRVKGGRSDVVVGTRSAVFAPLDRLALVIVDEEHDGSYKQEDAPRYHGRDVAIVRARDAGATVVLGSATPAIESRYNAATGKYQLMEIEERVFERPLPETTVVDMRQEFAETGRQHFFSRRLEEEIAARLEQREQILILLNRRGYSAFVLCRSCGKAIECANCSIVLTHHRRTARLLCHYCGFERGVPRACPECASEHLYFVGEGSEKIEDALHRRFPEARIGRLDRDAARGRGQAELILAAFRSHEFDILVGTQMIAKGHDIHLVTLVGVVSADVGLARPDFRAAERTFQLMTQVSGRAGRGALPGEVIIQTYYPEHYAIRAAAAQDYAMFYKQEIRFRELMHYPPFTVLANILVKNPSAETALKLTGSLGRHLESAHDPGLKILGPAAAPIHRLKKDYR
ncbi:MAG: replication restart helicase PriA, partial [Terriglobia bacterium]